MTYHDIQDDKRYPAIFRGPDGQLLSTGEAQFRTLEHRGCFWPREEAYIAAELDPVTSVEIVDVDGARMSVSRCDACPDPWPPHYHFEYQAAG